MTLAGTERARSWLAWIHDRDTEKVYAMAKNIYTSLHIYILALTIFFLESPGCFRTILLLI